MSEQVKSEQVKSEQVKSEEVKSEQVKSEEVMSEEVERGGRARRFDFLHSRRTYGGGASRRRLGTMSSARRPSRRFLDVRLIREFIPHQLLVPRLIGRG
jgi:hypothetical protein